MSTDVRGEEQERTEEEAPEPGLRATESAERGEVDPAVELVARTLCAGIGATGFRCAAIIHEEHRNAAREVLTALRRDGLALPPVVQTREEWRVVYDDRGTLVEWLPPTTNETRARRALANCLRNWPSAELLVRTVTTFADDGSPYGGATLTGKWRNVDE